MTHRQAAIWREKILRYERETGTHYCWVDIQPDGERWYITVSVDGVNERLYSAEECKMWITDRF